MPSKPTAAQTGTHRVHAPTQVTAEGVEAHPHHTGHHLVDYAVAGSAIVISLVSLFVAIEHGHTMQKLVAANSWPLLQYNSSNTDEKSLNPKITLSVINAGVGPAIVKNFTVKHAGKSFKNPYDLLASCCGFTVKSVDTTKLTRGNPIVSTVDNTVIQAGQKVDYLFMDPADWNIDSWRKLDRERFKLTFDVCYCSVLKECWRSDLTGIEPEKVENCPAPSSNRK
jgi:hypothetical protein